MSFYRRPVTLILSLWRISSTVYVISAIRELFTLMARKAY